MKNTSSNFQLLALLVLLGFLPRKTEAQNTRNIDNQRIAWVGYINTLQFSPRWFLTSEIQTRYYLPNFEHQLWAVRFRVYRKMGRGWDMAMAGIARFSNTRNAEDANALVTPELRPMLELNHRQLAGEKERFLVHHRYLAEARFFRKTENGALAKGYNFNWRFRYRFGADYDLTKLKPTGNYLKIRLFDELMVNAGRQIGHNFFDQNRVFAGLQIPVSKNLNLEIGYLKMWQQRSSGNDFFDRDLVRATLLHLVKV